ncbi:hypothetical protein [Paraburkholderia sp. BL17N1]|uniref:hypothetical protein n=1 Tax=Paraburkholderia sp. BL17N1 TaxID=1938798 RepID=UPI000EB4776B|nr:hypothetical protein [Paraburkholderia sp. BL17N1]RKR46266.1 hypothetical protein B0G82_3948 [Paraburkholderia sp. BL17N1]
MEAIKHGGPAFPISNHAMVHSVATAAIQGVTDSAERDRLYIEAQARATAGMTLRDYFAAKALTGWMATYATDANHPCGKDSPQEWADAIADASYRLADAMLRARGQS